MKMYRFVTTTHHDVQAETLEEAIDAFNEMKRGGLSWIEGQKKRKTSLYLIDR